MRWTRESIIDEIKRLNASGEELNYAAAEAKHLNLVRAAAWHFGTWGQAIETAGMVYEDLAKYQRWSRERIVQRIRDLHAAGADLSWRSVSTRVDPPLAAAALRANGFASWREAIAAAGLSIDTVARYKYWSNERVIDDIKARQAAGLALSSKVMQESDQSLFCAARRRFGSWDNALEAAMVDATGIRLRKATPARQARRRRHALSAAEAGGEPAALNGSSRASDNGAAAQAAPATTKGHRGGAPRS